MKYSDWKKFYLEIVEDFGYNVSEDEKGAEILVSLLGTEQKIADPEKLLIALIEGRDSVIIGPCISPDDLGNAVRGEDVLIATAGEGTKNALESGIVPDLIFTDLDKFPDADLEANRKGAIVVIHAHGDNMHMLTKWVSRFHDNVIPTCQCAPFEGIYNWGGFTDGDRGYCLLENFGSAHIKLLGFDFQEPCGSSRTDTDTKRKKLQWAKRIIESL